MTGGNRNLAYQMRALRTSARLLHLGAHPDDEDAGMLARMSLGDGVRTVYWSATRGEGGQNFTGPERDAALGLVRTWESLDARRVDGGEVLYGPFHDFGFSKTGEAVLARWGHEELVREIVRAIRMVQPHVVVTRWSGEAGDGHGQHRAVGMVSEQAFEAAADAGRYPELGLPPWSASKLYRSLGGDWQPGQATERGRIVGGEGVVSIDAGEVDAVSGLTYEELASIGLTRHRSQGIGVLPPPGPFFYCYEIVRSRVLGGGSFFDGIDTTLGASATDPDLRGSLARAEQAAIDAADAFRPDEPSRAVPFLLGCLTALRDAIERADATMGHGLRWRARAVEELAVRCSGVRLRCSAEPIRVSPGGRARITARADVDDARIEIASVRLSVPDGWTVTRAQASGTTSEVAFDVQVPESAAFSTPYWLREPRDGATYRWPAHASHALPLDPPLVEAVWELRYDGHELSASAPPERREAFPGGTRARSFSVLPSIGLRPAMRQVFVKAGSQSQRLTLMLAAEATQESATKGTLSVHVPSGWDVHPRETEVVCRYGEREVVQHDVAVPAGSAPGRYTLSYRITSDEVAHGVTLDPVRRGPDGSAADERTATREAFLLSPADVAIDVVDVSFVPGLRYAYVTGVEDATVSALTQLGVDISPVSEETLAYGDLGSFDAIVVGPRAYALRSDVRANAGRLLEYVEHGGTLVVQHQGYGYEEGGAAPYPFAYADPHDRVTDPAAVVELLDPEHPVLRTPNPIAPSDFDGWVHDRGMYFFSEHDPRYVPLLGSADPGESRKDGGLLIAAVGRGTYVYTGYSFFRQIPAGVAGAIRLFANILGLPDAKIRERVAAVRSVSLFAGTSDDELYEIARLASERWIDAGGFVCREGERSDEMFILIDGAVDVCRGDSVIARAEPGDVIGELAALAEVPRTASLRARAPLRVLVVRGAQLRAMLASRPGLAARMIGILAEKLATSGGV